MTRTESTENDTIRDNDAEITIQERLSVIFINRGLNGFRISKRRAKKVPSFKMKAVAVPVTPNL